MIKLNDILKEIKINDPNSSKTWEKRFQECWEKAEEYIGEWNEDEEEYENEDEISQYARELFKEKYKKNWDSLSEDINDFKVGDEKIVHGDKHKITDINPETQSISWDIKKTLTDQDIHRYLSELIKKLESNKNDYYDSKRIAKLLQKLKFIRNTFKRSSI